MKKQKQTLVSCLFQMRQCVYYSVMLSTMNSAGAPTMMGCGR